VDQPLQILLVIHSVWEVIDRDHIRSFHIDWNFIDFEEKIRTVIGPVWKIHWVLNQLNFSNSNSDIIPKELQEVLCGN